MPKPFTHLHTHSHYSLLSALPKIPDLVARAKEYGMDTLALTDNGNLYGAIEFYKACTKAGIKPILGLDAYVAVRTRHNKDAGVDNRRYRIVLLAENEAGYRNLIKLVTKSHLEGFYYKPRIDHELMELHHEGLIALMPSIGGEHGAHVKTSAFDEAVRVVKEHQHMFGKENLFLEITHHPEIEGHSALQKRIAELGVRTGAPLVASHEVSYLNPDDRPARETLLSIQGTFGSREHGGLTSNEENFSFISPEQASLYFKDFPDALAKNREIADRVNLTLELGKWLFPALKLSEDMTPEDRLRHIVETGLARRELAETPEIRERIEYELDTICSKGYAPYFLVVSDLLRYAHDLGILTTIRGSVAGSLVTYLAGITNINPLEYDLPFERFLNPERPSPPDIDMDFADDRRDEMIAYARKTYGEDHVAQIGTFGTMMARAAVRDTARALGFEYATGDRIAKLIPFGSQGFPMTLEKAFEAEPALKQLYETDEDTRRVIDMAKKIEGNARHISVHAAGVVISPVPLDEIVPVQFDQKGEGKIITQYDMHSIEDAGLLKFDFLGLTNLAVLADALKRVKKLYDTEIDIENIPLDDEETFKTLARGETVGVFQLAGRAMTQFLKELKPSTIHDINAMIALYRPGPMKNIPEYIARKHGLHSVTYYHPKMQKFLEKSYGILVYQEDIMLTALEVAGYTWKTVDKLRKAIGKKIPREMAEQHEVFVAGCMEHSQMTKEKAEGLWNLFEPFQGYGFNRAHAASYGKVAYQTAYMKSRYPHVFMASLLTAESGNMDKIAEIITECKRMEIPVLPPDVNDSLGDFTVAFESTVEVGIRFGLHSIKNVGEGIADAIIEERKESGPYKNLADFLERINNRNLNKKSLESLIKCGALDAFGERGELLLNTDDLLTYSRHAGNVPDNQDSLFTALGNTVTLPGLKLKPATPATFEEKLLWEKELIGVYISGHPLDSYKEKLEKFKSDIATIKEEVYAGTPTIAVGMLEEYRPIMTRAGEHMAFARLSDYSGTIEIVIFPRLFKAVRETLEKGGCIAVKGTMSDRNNEASIIAEVVKAI